MANIIRCNATLSSGGEVTEYTIHAQLNVYSTTGSTVSVTYPSGKVVTGAESSTAGLWLFNVTENGTYSIASTLSGETVRTVQNISMPTVSYNNTAFKDPNKRYESKSLGTLSSASDVDTFLSKYTHANNYVYSSSDYLSLGNYVTIQDGTYNVDWEIAGFDCEYNNTASDGQVKSNGYGIFMIPKRHYAFKNYYAEYDDPKPYIDSNIHTWLNSTVYNNLYNILGNHIINRNVLLGSEILGTSPYANTTSAYTWTTAYLTLMTVCQLTGTKASNNNLYDDGEANYKLPLFNQQIRDLKDYRSSFYLRNNGGNRNGWCVWWCEKLYTVTPSITYGSPGYSDRPAYPLMLIR